MPFVTSPKQMSIVHYTVSLRSSRPSLMEFPSAVTQEQAFFHNEESQDVIIIFLSLIGIDINSSATSFIDSHSHNTALRFLTDINRNTFS